MIHQSVLLEEVVQALNLKPGESLLDATVNRAGHAARLCQFLGSTGLLIGLDADREALAEAAPRLQSCPCSIKLIATNFRYLDQELTAAGVGQVDAVLMDLGLSSEELETSGRGFSFQRDEPLLMTYTSQPGSEELTAARIVNSWSERQLFEMIRELGEERFARPIAKGIVGARRQEPILTTGQLVAVIRQAVPEWYTRTRLHFATKTFQALRLATNDELTSLVEGLQSAWLRLRLGGRLAVISFHSLEARLVKNFFQNLVRSDEARFVHKKVIKPNYAEVRQNPRARSAQLRTITKII